MKKPAEQNPGHHPATIFGAIVKIICVTVFVMSSSWLFLTIFDKYMTEQLTKSDMSDFIIRYMGFLIVGALLGVAISTFVQHGLEELHRQIMQAMRRMSPQLMASGSLGLVVGMIFATLAGLPLYIYFPEHRTAGFAMTLCAGVIFGYLGILIFSRLNLWPERGGAAVGPFSRTRARPKVLDSSAIIDGRVYQLCEAGFMEGRILVPSLVLNEVQKIADDDDSVRKQRGRRGLEIIEKLRDNPEIDLEVMEVKKSRDSFDETVDAQLVAYTKSVRGMLVTNDYNLTKVAELRGVRVYNLNILSNSIRKTLLPGEIVDVHVVKYGKETGQGIAYLDDGTMIVIESGDKFIGESIRVEINSIMQTVAGRLIFARVAHE